MPPLVGATFTHCRFPQRQSPIQKGPTARKNSAEVPRPETVWRVLPFPRASRLTSARFFLFVEFHVPLAGRPQLWRELEEFYRLSLAALSFVEPARFGICGRQGLKIQGQVHVGLRIV